jgi:hypothetical protein
MSGPNSQENASVTVSAAAMTPSTWGAIAAEFAITLLFEAEQPPWIIAQHLEQAGQGREELSSLKDLPCGIADAPLGKLPAENLLPLPLRPHTFLRHTKRARKGGGC